jgi:hypothetical protein
LPAHLNGNHARRVVVVELAPHSVKDVLELPPSHPPIPHQGLDRLAIEVDAVKLAVAELSIRARMRNSELLGGREAAVQGTGTCWPKQTSAGR